MQRFLGKREYSNKPIRLQDWTIEIHVHVDVFVNNYKCTQGLLAEGGL